MEMDDLKTDLLANCEDPSMLEDFAMMSNCSNDPRVQRRPRELRDRQHHTILGKWCFGVSKYLF